MLATPIIDTETDHIMTVVCEHPMTSANNKVTEILAYKMMVSYN